VLELALHVNFELCSLLCLVSLLGYSRDFGCEVELGLRK
jgi:hypothetical protein